MSETTDLVTTGTQDAAGTDEAPAASGTTGSARRRGNGLSGMLLPELQRLAVELGITGTGRMRKGDLVAAISDRQVGGGSASAATSTNGASNDASNDAPAPADGAPAARGIATTSAPLEAPVTGGANGGPLTGATEGAAVTRPVRSRRGASRPAGSP
ncbi:MAG: transcription termination factor Rho, partial [Blastococcus sp.]|nr:transcription termination factor Rho [Blastococcus sp.]